MVFFSKTILSALPHPDTLLYLTHLPCDKHKLPQGHGVGQKGPAHPHFHPARKMNTSNYIPIQITIKPVTSWMMLLTLPAQLDWMSQRMLSIACTIDNNNNQNLQFN